MKELLQEPAVILIIVEVIALVVAKLDKSNSVANIIKKLSEKLQS